VAVVRVGAQACSRKPAVFTVTTAADVALLTKAAFCSDATVNAVWQADLQLADTIVVGNGTSLTVTGVTQKTSVIDGGAQLQLFDVWGKLILTDVSLINNYAAGSAVFLRQKATLSATRSLFSNNAAVDEYDGIGSAVFGHLGSTVKLNNCTVSGNTASYGAAVHTRDNCTISISKSVFYKNAGGAIRADTGSTVTLTTSVFDSNTADYGSVVYLTEGVINISHCEIKNNAAKYRAGAIYIEKGSLTIASSTLTNNTAELDGK
jgi:Right handed beta helix region